MRGAKPTAVQSPTSKIQSSKLSGWIPPPETALARQLKVSLICLLLVVALSLVGHRAFWKAKLDQFSPTIQGAYGSYVSGRVGEYIDAEMVRAFVVAPEYRTRFGVQ